MNKIQHLGVWLGRERISCGQVRFRGSEEIVVTAWFRQSQHWQVSSEIELVLTVVSKIMQR